MDFLHRVSQQFGELECNDNSVVTVLGKSYGAIKGDTEQDEGGASGYGVFGQLFNRNFGWNRQFLADVESIIHFTYRTRFEPILRDPEGPSPLNFSTLFRDNPLNTLDNALNHPDSFCSDIGWGCMIRTGQTLLGNALQRLKLGREYRVPENATSEILSSKELELVSWFEDKHDAPFSLHRFVEKGRKLSGKSAGEWFGPSATSLSIKALVEEFGYESGIDTCIISTDSADVYEEEMDQVFDKKSEANILLLLGVKLGLSGVNERYWDSLKQLLASPQSVGISGGRPSSSLYFFGLLEDYLLYLDPHSPQTDLAGIESPVEKLRSVHYARFNKMHISEMDPSMLIGVLIQGRDDWLQWRNSVENSQIFHVSATRPQEFYLDDDDDVESLHSKEANKPLIGGDYVDVAPMVQLAGVSRDDAYYDVKCKNQKIVVVGEYDNSATDMEVDQVLVEQETVPVPEPAV
ncbi:LAMI_0F14774g1_1 [Lachancea mirantina]|uniref:Cysteine protease n=1 Tax=Lachancea mirantina TaxID=1230905 RepID=A0A1G4K415_9SACH|nr:LAMI_0F14774g1_1 [Lachancea mirantina]